MEAIEAMPVSRGALVSLGFCPDLKTAGWAAMQRVGSRIELLDADTIRTQADIRKCAWDDARSRTRQILHDATTLMQRYEPQFFAVQTVAPPSPWWTEVHCLRLIGALQGVVHLVRETQWVELESRQVIAGLMGDESASRAAMGRALRNRLHRADLTGQVEVAAAAALAALLRVGPAGPTNGHNA